MFISLGVPLARRAAETGVGVGGDSSCRAVTAAGEKHWPYPSTFLIPGNYGRQQAARPLDCINNLSGEEAATGMQSTNKEPISSKTSFFVITF